MKIQILGPGCANCTRLLKTTEAAAKALGVDYQLEKITDLDQIMTFAIMMPPGLVVDGEVKSVGKVPSLDEIKKMLQ